MFFNKYMQTNELLSCLFWTSPFVKQEKAPKLPTGWSCLKASFLSKRAPGFVFTSVCGSLRGFALKK